MLLLRKTLEYDAERAARRPEGYRQVLQLTHPIKRTDRKPEWVGDNRNERDRICSGIVSGGRCKSLVCVEAAGSNAADCLVIFVFPPEKTAPRVTTSGWTFARSLGNRGNPTEVLYLAVYDFVILGWCACAVEALPTRGCTGLLRPPVSKGQRRRTNSESPGRL